ncbi:TetR/AcrR family transcriptional regulator [Actinomadura flavalba]|uniref:TetR/AcrR family transcriptional regulator n=1 Tax=Actinomadura flavalba TaxID=1120938 RepID=UPI0003740C89|nr:TetR/AcrR family transcriptional regulator [Actinomadura flavalba]
MTTEYSGTGDPARTLRLLWNAAPPPRRGPKPRFTVREIVGRAVGVADGEGLEALSIRRVADELGVSPMSLYTYVPGKAELIDLMLDRAYGELEPPPDGASWRAALTHVASGSWRLYHRHPWLLQVVTARPPLGPHALARYENALRAVEGLGLTDVEMDSVVALVEGFAASAARTSVDAAQAERRTGLTDRQWWDATGPVLATVVDPGRYPLAARVGSAAGEEHQAPADPGHAFAFGLDRILDGVEALITSR